MLVEGRDRRKPLLGAAGEEQERGHGREGGANRHVAPTIRPGETAVKRRPHGPAIGGIAFRYAATASRSAAGTCDQFVTTEAIEPPSES